MLPRKASCSCRTREPVDGTKCARCTILRTKPGMFHAGSCSPVMHTATCRIVGNPTTQVPADSVIRGQGKNSLREDKNEISTIVALVLTAGQQQFGVAAYVERTHREATVGQPHPQSWRKPPPRVSCPFFGTIFLVPSCWKSQRANQRPPGYMPGRERRSKERERQGRDVGL